MAKIASCKDTGQNCDFVIQGETEEELLANAAQHGTDVHRIGSQEDEYARTFGRDFVSSSGGAGAGISGARADWLQKVKDAIPRRIKPAPYQGVRLVLRDGLDYLDGLGRL